VSGQSFQIRKRDRAVESRFSKGAKGGAAVRNLEERSGADTHTFAKDANVWGTRPSQRQRQNPRTYATVESQVSKSAPPRWQVPQPKRPPEPECYLVVGIVCGLPSEARI